MKLLKVNEAILMKLLMEFFLKNFLSDKSNFRNLREHAIQLHTS